MYLYQIRTTGGRGARKLLQTDSLDEIKSFFASRNPDFYEIFGLEPLTMRLIWVWSARVFLDSITKTARAGARNE